MLVSTYTKSTSVQAAAQSLQMKPGTFRIHHLSQMPPFLKEDADHKEVRFVIFIDAMH